MRTGNIIIGLENVAGPHNGFRRHPKVPHQIANYARKYFGTTGYTTSVYVQFGTPEVQFGTPQILQCNFGTPQGRFRYTFRSFLVPQQIIKIMTVRNNDGSLVFIVADLDTCIGLVDWSLARRRDGHFQARRRNSLHRKVTLR